ncbi:MAG TPA: phosphoglycerate kinase [Candidatus Caldiarchaeum subterraneum]|uniref:Phosphoglycerate kinase n=1 Tax=Caldiarchaeum subterraneum TaxID=311458 RepID=A0A833EAL1_CALS0|nr:phosphoglycerate kinase [Aigarchaeota archaeon]HIQ30494.1 phosphoglycerate kinase [Candidatus Caldarchaeum subterraneum]
MDIEFLTIDDLDLAGKTVLVRVDINTPVDPNTGGLLEINRIKECSVTLRSLEDSKVVVASHQGRVGRYDYVSMRLHAKVLSEVMDREVKFVDDVFGKAAREAIENLKVGEILLLENLRFTAEENFEFSPEDAAKTHIVRNLSKHLDACVLDAFPTAHRAHPSIVGFAEVLPTCAGRLVAKELKSLSRVVLTAKAPYTTVLGGAKISDRLEAIDALIENGKADNVLLTGLIAQVFLKAANKIKFPLQKDLEKYVPRARELLNRYSENFYMPDDLAINKNGERVEVRVEELKPDMQVYDIGEQTIRKYSKIIRSSGTVFMSGPPGFFEKVGFDKGTNELILALASSLGTTIISGGHLTAALERLGVKEWIDHISTAGGALVMFMAGKRLPLIEALKRASKRWREEKALQQSRA